MRLHSSPIRQCGGASNDTPSLTLSQHRVRTNTSFVVHGLSELEPGTSFEELAAFDDISNNGNSFRLGDLGVWFIDLKHLFI